MGMGVSNLGLKHHLILQSSVGHVIINRLFLSKTPKWPEQTGHTKFLSLVNMFLLPAP